MIIKTSQLTKLSHVKTEEFVKKTVLFLHENFAEWVDGKDNAELKKYIHHIIHFGKNHKIFEKPNLKKLVQYNIHYNFEIPLPKKLALILNEYKFSENQRVENFYIALESNRYKLIEINLDTNLDANAVTPVHTHIKKSKKWEML